MSVTSLAPAWRLAQPGPDVAEPILAIQALRYEAEGRPGALPAISGLRLQALGVPGAVQGFDPTTGHTFLRDLPPGPRRILVTDPDRRYLPAALTVNIPARFRSRPTLAQMSEGLGPLRIRLRLRPSPSRAIPDGMTAVIGRLRNAQGRGIALGRLECITMQNGKPLRVVTWTDADGGFALLLPGEAPRLDAPPPPPTTRELTVRLPVAKLAAALATDFLGALPEGLDGMEAERQADLFAPCEVRLQAADGSPAEQAPGLLPIRPGRTVRWDLVCPH